MLYELDYATIAERILATGYVRKGRNSSTTALHGVSLSLNCHGKTFPILLGRTMYPKGVLGELAAMLRGPKQMSDFKLFGCNYWDIWCAKNGKINIDYGNKWKNFNGVNQLDNVLQSLVNDPYSRRHIISGWDPATQDTVDLPCCHLLYQWVVDDKNMLHMMWYQRSADWMIGVPSDALFAYTWNILMANAVGLKPGSVTMFFGDAHIYEAHYGAAKEYLRRVQSLQPKDGLPYYELLLAEGAHPAKFKPEHLRINNYNPSSPINLELIK